MTSPSISVPFHQTTLMTSGDFAFDIRPIPPEDIDDFAIDIRPFPPDDIDDFTLDHIQFNYAILVCVFIGYFSRHYFNKYPAHLRLYVTIDVMHTAMHYF